jgi:GDP-L-fucose synthase
MEKSSKILIAGRSGLVGSAIERALIRQGYHNIVGPPHKDLDLTDQKAVETFFNLEHPEYVFLAAAIVGGINANNTYPANFIYSNLEIQNNIIHTCYTKAVKKLLFLGSVCIYPKMAEQPMKEECLLTGALEPTNLPYAVAKISGLTMCQSYNRQYGTNYISVMPTNLYGPGDNYDLQNSHVLPAMIRRFHEAKMKNTEEVVLWGTGTPTREFMHSDDVGDACVFLMNEYNSNEIINVGVSSSISIRELAVIVKEIVGYKGWIKFDTTKPDGQPFRQMDSTKIHKMGWKHKVSLEEGIKMTYGDFLRNPKIKL